MRQTGLRRGGLFFTAILVVSMAWLGRHSLLTQPSIFQASKAIAGFFRLPTPAAQRPELLHIVSHSRFGADNGNQPLILGQIYNPQPVALARPTINVIVVDKDNHAIGQHRFSAQQWQSTGHLIDSQSLIEFQLELPAINISSWGYRLQLSD